MEEIKLLADGMAAMHAFGNDGLSRRRVCDLNPKYFNVELAPIEPCLVVHPAGGLVNPGIRQSQ
jgi:hypothetical protein